jgi:phage terminase large subunit
MIVDVLPHQKKFILSNKRHTALVGGYGSGKSFAGVCKTVIKKMQLQGIPVAYYLPTYGLITDVAVPKFQETFDSFDIKSVWHRQDKKIITPYGDVFLRSMDNPDTIIGYEVGYSLIDETDILRQDKMNDVFSKIIGRNRAVLPKGFVNHTDVVGTPEGFKWLYKFFVKDASNNKHIINARTEDNPFLPPDYIQSLIDSYTKEQLEAYLNGEFVNLTSGTVYREFDRKRHLNNDKEAGNNILYIGMDFNITNMAATVSIKEGNVRYVVDEVVDAYDTGDMISIINERYPANRKIVYPDAAGNARNTSGKSDHDLLRKAGFKVIAPSKNPSVRDRINSVNKDFADNLTFINGNKCPSLVDALEKQSYNKHGEPDKQSGHDHINDAFGYEVTNSKTGTIKKRSSNVF